MKAFTKINPQRIELQYHQQILPEFTNNIPKNVLKWKKSVSMAICLTVLLVTSLTATSIQRATELLSIGEQHGELNDPSVDLPQQLRIYSPKMPLANDVRATLMLWPQSCISARYRRVTVRFIKEIKKSRLFKRLHQKKAIPIAFDMTEVDYYGQDEQTTMYTKGRSAAKRCHLYLTMQILCPAFRLIVDAQPIFPNSKPLGKIMKDMLRRARRNFNLKLDPIYLDRGFYQIEVLKELYTSFDRKFLLPAIRTKRVEDTIVKWHKEHGYTAGRIELVIK